MTSFIDELRLKKNRFWITLDMDNKERKCVNIYCYNILLTYNSINSRILVLEVKTDKILIEV